MLTELEQSADREARHALRDVVREMADRIKELEAEVARLRLLVPRPDQTEDELVWRDHMRGVPIAALGKLVRLHKGADALPTEENCRKQTAPDRRQRWQLGSTQTRRLLCIARWKTRYTSAATARGRSTTTC